MNSSDFSNYKYPQYLWCKEIISALEKLNLDANNFIDAPCGNGIISYWLQKHLDQANFQLMDIDENSIAEANHLADGNRQLEVSLGDIYTFSTPYDREETVFLLINSLFLLPETEKLLSIIHKSSAHSVVILPHIEHKNFRTFYKKRPTYPLHYYESMSNVDQLFRDNGFTLLYSKEICNIAHHTLPKLPIIYSLLLKICNLIEPRLRTKSPAYYLLIYKNDETN